MAANSFLESNCLGRITLVLVLLMYKIDLSIFHKVDNQELIAHIDRVGIVFYESNIAQETA